MEKRLDSSNVCYAIYFVIALFFVGLRALSAFGLLSFLGSFSGYVFSFVVQVLLLGVGSVLIFSLCTKSKIRTTLKNFRLKKISNKAVAISFLIGLIVFFLNVFASSFFNTVISWFGYVPNMTGAEMTTYPFWLLIVNLIFTAVLPAICEELVHRGMLLRNTFSKHKWVPIVVSSLLFGLLHLNIEQFFYASLIGLFLGYLTALTNSIYPAMIVHFMNNALSVFLSFSSVRGLPFGGIFGKINLILNSNLLIGILFVVLFCVLLLQILRYLVQSLSADCFSNSIKQSRNVLENALKRGLFLMEIEEIKSGKQEQNFKLSIPYDEIFVPKQETKMPKFALAFMILSFIMLGAGTIFTFVWGVL